MYISPSPVHFNPRSRTGSDGRKGPANCQRIISIHAPAQGATLDVIKLPIMKKISIHAPAQGATSGERVSSIMPRYFNPRSRTGSDMALPGWEQAGKISIHAPAQGATGRAAAARAQLAISIHAPAQGATLPSVEPVLLRSIFQSTLPHRERPSWSAVMPG